MQTLGKLLFGWVCFVGAIIFMGLLKAAIFISSMFWTLVGVLLISLIIGAVLQDLLGKRR